jgi:hypothetical protein
MDKDFSAGEKRKLTQFAHALIARARDLERAAEPEQFIPQPKFTSQASNSDALLLHLGEQREYLLQFSAKVSAQLNVLNSTISRLSTEIAKVAGEVDGLRRERTELRQSLASAKQDLVDVGEAMVVRLTQEFDRHVDFVKTFSGQKPR